MKLRNKIIIFIIFFFICIGFNSCVHSISPDSYTIADYEGKIKISDIENNLSFMIEDPDILLFKNKIIYVDRCSSYVNLYMFCSNGEIFLKSESDSSLKFCAFDNSGNSVPCYYLCISGSGLNNIARFNKLASIGVTFDEFSMSSSLVAIGSGCIGLTPLNSQYVSHNVYELNYISSSEYYPTETLLRSSTVGNGDFYSSVVNLPSFRDTAPNWDTGIWDYVVVYSNDYIEDKWKDIYLLSYDYGTKSDESLSIYPKKVIPITGGTSSSYYTNTNEYGYTFMIPTSEFGLNFKSNHSYTLKLAFKELVDYEGSSISTYNYFTTYNFTVGTLNTEDILNSNQNIINNKLDEQTNIIKEQTQVIEQQTQAIKEQHETSKGIWGSIKEVLSYINPFSENFFAYNLVELIINGIKSLFIPSDGFIENFFNNLKNWFSDRLGFLFYPFELIIDILNKMLNINFSEPVFNIPDINEPFTNTKLISATTYNLNSLLENGVFKTIHDIYFVFVDAFIIFGLVNLAKRKFEEVMSK